MPDIRPFRALRFDPEVVGDLGRVVAPPYDVIGPELHQALLERHPLNSVRLDLPLSEPGEDPDERYRRVARTFAAWRSDGTLRKDPRPAVYVYEQTYRVPGTKLERTQRGFFARLRLEPFGAQGGVLPHERTLSGPKEDRYRLLRATGVNTSPVVGMFEDPAREARAIMTEVAATSPVADVTDDDGVRHRLWVVFAAPAPRSEEGPGEPAADAAPRDDAAPNGHPASADDRSAGDRSASEAPPSDDPATRLLRIASAGPVYIADGHHRYETALRYRDERRMTRSCEPDPAFDFLLMLFLDAADHLTVLPTHRVVLGLGDDGLSRLAAGLDRLFVVQPTDRATLVARFEAAGELAGGDGRMGLVTRNGAWMLEAKRDAFEGSLAPGGPAVRALDVSLLSSALDALLGIDAAAVAGGERIRYAKSATEAAALVDGRVDGADATFLLEPTPVASILAVAREGDVMPQKSTYFYPKALTGLVLNPHEW